MAAPPEPSDEELRRRLEGSVFLLEASRVRYRALVPALAAWSWRQRLRAVADIAREVCLREAEVEQALSRAERRAKVEGWPEGAVSQLLAELAALRQRLASLVERRLGSPEGVGGLRALLERVLGVPRKVPMGEREAAAHEALEADEALIPTLHRFGLELERVWGRPLTRGQRLPFTLSEFDALDAQRTQCERALAEAWARVARIDTSGGVERELSRRAKRPVRDLRGQAGPRALVHATFWQTAADSHLRVVLAERFSPLTVLEPERAEGLRFLLAREVDGAARLPGEGARGALLMLAHELTASPEGRAPLSGGHAQVRAWAGRADALEGDDDWRRLRDGLRTLAARSFRSALPPLYRVGKRTEREALPERLSDFFSAQE